MSLSMKRITTTARTPHEHRHRLHGRATVVNVSSNVNFDAPRMKHLELIQGVIARLANEAALVRGWALTISAAFFGFAAKSLNWRIAAVGMLPVIAFWWLNAYYLRAERQYRALYDRVRLGDPTLEPFAMNARGEEVMADVPRTSVRVWLRLMWSQTLRVFYGMMFVVGLVLIVAGFFKN
jgi:hypothetical protein